MKTMIGIVLALAGCGADTNENGAPGSCDTRTTNGVCSDYVGPASVVAAYRSACVPGVWADARCNRATSVGGCQTVSTSPQLTLTNWFFAPQTAATVRQACAAPSSFVSP